MPKKKKAVRTHLPRIAPPPPTRADVEERFLALLEGRMSRDEVNRWAMQWVAADDDGVDDTVVWQGLNRLAGIDLRHGPDSPYLHPDEQVRDWLDDFRRASADTPA